MCHDLPAFLQTLSSAIRRWCGRQCQLSDMLEELDEYVVACDDVPGACPDRRYGDLERDRVTGTPTHVRLAENQNVGERMWEGLTRLPTECVLRISKRRGIWTMGSGQAINFLSPLRNVERVS